MAWKVATQSMWQAGSHADCFCTNYKFQYASIILSRLNVEIILDLHLINCLPPSCMTSHHEMILIRMIYQYQYSFINVVPGEERKKMIALRLRLNYKRKILAHELCLEMCF